MATILGLITPKNTIYCVESGSTLRSVLEKFKFHKYSVVPFISKQGKYLGTISEGDLLRYITDLPNFSLQLAEKISIDTVARNRSYKALNNTATLQEVLTLSLEQNFTPLVDDRGLFIGIVKRKDVIAHMYEQNNG